MDTLIILVALGLLYWWSHHHAQAIAARAKERQDNCPHPPEAQETMRVNNIITMNGALLHRVIPGRRHLVKHCLACGKQRQMYRPTLQPFDKFMAEFDQETIDRAVQLQARTQRHLNEKANEERIRLLKREREMKA